MLRSVDWELFTDASGQPGGPIFQVQSVTSLGVIYRRFGTTWRSHLPGSISHIFKSQAVFIALLWKMGPPGFPETSVIKCQTMPLTSQESEYVIYTAAET